MSGNVASLCGPSAVAAEQRAREFLAQNQWRKARDELKPLTKLDRARFLPLLIRANIGLSREMMAKGQVAEAQQVLSYLAGIATTEQLRAAEQEVLEQVQPSSGAGQALAQELGHAEAPRTEKEKLALADKLVLTFKPVEPGPGIDPRVPAELKAIHDALFAASIQQWDRLPEILRSVPHRSLFAHWSAYIKGQAAFHAGEDERALRFLGALPSESVPARAGQAYLFWIRAKQVQKGKEPVSESILEGVCRLLGQPGAGALLLRADKLWKNGSHSESYLVMRDGIPSFPAQTLDWLGTLTDFYFKAPFTLSETDHDKYLHHFDDALFEHAIKNGVEEMLVYRLFAISGSDRVDWERFLRMRQSLYPANPRFASLVYGCLGQRLAKLETNPYSWGSPPRPMDGPGAVACLRKAVALDPNNLAAHLRLVDLYTTLKQLPERNRLLDQMVGRFPDETRVLIDAAIGCIDRAAYTKGLGYLERARELDQLDPRIPDLIVRARRQLAQQHFKQRRPDKARQALAGAEPFLTDKPDDFRRARWAARLEESLLEAAGGDPARAGELLSQARAASPFPAAFLLFGHLASSSNTAAGSPPHPFWTELTEALRPALPVRQLAFLVRVIDHWRDSGAADQIRAAQNLVRKSLKRATGLPFTREEARQLLELRLQDPDWRQDLAVLAAKILKSDPQDPLFRFFKLHLKGDLARRSNQNRAELDVIQAEAARRGDDATAQRAHHLSKQLQAPPAPRFRPPPEPDWMEEDDDDFEMPIHPDELMEDLPPEVEGQFSALISMLSSLPDSEIEKARRTRPKEIPADIFEALIALSRGKLPPLPNPARPEERGPSGSSRLSDAEPANPGQLDLF
jgi:tetratricopeptide (TPR) repeat protein